MGVDEVDPGVAMSQPGHNGSYSATEVGVGVGTRRYSSNLSGVHARNTATMRTSRTARLLMGIRTASPNKGWKNRTRDCLNHNPLITDTRPLPDRPSVRYAGCMTVHPASPISCVYSSQPQLSTASMAPAQTFETVGHLEHLDTLNAGKQTTARETSRTRCSRCSNGKDDLLVRLGTRCSEWGWIAHLVPSRPCGAAPRASGRDGVPLPTAARRAPIALALSGGGR